MMIEGLSSLTFLLGSPHILWKKNVCSISRESKCDVLQHFFKSYIFVQQFLLSTPPRSPQDVRLENNLFINASNGAFYATGIPVMHILWSDRGGFVKVWNAIFLIVLCFEKLLSEFQKPNRKSMFNYLNPQFPFFVSSIHKIENYSLRM